MNHIFLHSMFFRLSLMLLLDLTIYALLCILSQMNLNLFSYRRGIFMLLGFDSFLLGSSGLALGVARWAGWGKGLAEWR